MSKDTFFFFFFCLFLEHIVTYFILRIVEENIQSSTRVIYDKLNVVELIES